MVTNQFSNLNIVTVIQARMGSSRLPYKVTLSLAGKPLLYRMVERVKFSEYSGTVVIATTTDEIDDAIVELCEKYNFNCFRGHPLDLLDRHYQAAKSFNADIVLKIPSDVPLIDSAIISKVVKFFLDNRDSYDYVSNLHPATYPDGNDVEVMKMSALECAWKEAQLPMEREHTTPYLWEHPEKFRIGNVFWDTGLNYSMSHRWTIDYDEDYSFISKVYEELFPHKPHFGLYDILNLLAKKPDLMKINKKYVGVNWYRNHLHELKTITPEQTRRI